MGKKQIEAFLTHYVTQETQHMALLHTWPINMLQCHNSCVKKKKNCTSVMHTSKSENSKPIFQLIFFPLTLNSSLRAQDVQRNKYVKQRGQSH